MRGHEGDHVTGECLVREGPKDKNNKVHYTCENFPVYKRLFYYEGEVYKSCNAALEQNNLLRGSYFIDVDRKPILVECERQGKETQISISHDSFGIWHHLNNVAGTYTGDINYEQDLNGIIKLLDRSQRCRQLVKVKCYNSMLSRAYSWLRNRDRQKMTYWAGGPPDGKGCACGINASCASTSWLCNCDKNDNVLRSDDGYVTRKSDLPLTSFSTQDVDGTGEYKDIYIGKVECWTSKFSNR